MADVSQLSEVPHLCRKALLVHERLCAEYGCPIPYFHDLDPLSELVSSLLSHRTRNADSGRAFKELRAPVPRLGGGPRCADGRSGGGHRPLHLARAEGPAAPAGPPRGSARAAPAANCRSLDFLGRPARPRGPRLAGGAAGRRPQDQRRRAGSSAACAGPPSRWTATTTASPPRLGLIRRQVAVGPAHALLEAQLPPDWYAQQVYDNHEALMLHGQKLLLPRRPGLRPLRRAGSLPLRAGEAGTTPWRRGGRGPRGDGRRCGRPAGQAAVNAGPGEGEAGGAAGAAGEPGAALGRPAGGAGPARWKEAAAVPRGAGPASRRAAR